MVDFSNSVADFEKSLDNSTKTSRTDATAAVVAAVLLRPQWNTETVVKFLRANDKYSGKTESGVGVKVTTIHEVLSQLAQGGAVDWNGQRYHFVPVPAPQAAPQAAPVEPIANTVVKPTEKK